MICNLNSLFRTLLIFQIIFLFTEAFKSGDFNQAETELTINIGPGTKECFYQRAKEGDTIEIEYQVVDMNLASNLQLSHDMDINFYLLSPEKNQLVVDYKKPDALHRVKVDQEGDHELCFDNGINRFTTKTVYFEIYVDSNNDDNRWDEFDIPDAPTEIPQGEIYDSLMGTLNRVRDDLNQMNHFQDQKRALEARHRNIQEHNYSRVNNFSLLTIFVVLTVGAAQVFMLRSLFEEKSRLHKIFKLIT